MSNGGQASSGRVNLLRGVLIPEMYSCLQIPDITFAFDKSFLRPVRARTLEDDLARVRSASPSPAKIFIYGHTDDVGSTGYNKELSVRRAQAVFSFLTHDSSAWVAIHEEERWGRLEVEEATDALRQPGPKGRPPANTLPVEAYVKRSGAPGDPALLGRLYSDYMKHFLAQPLNTSADFCGPKPYMGCSELNPLIAGSKSKDKTTRDRENEPNRRVVIFLFKPDAKFPCKLKSLTPCTVFGYKPPAKGSGLFTCEFYDLMIANGKCPPEQKEPEKPPAPPPGGGGPAIEVILGFPAAEVDEQILTKHKTDPVLFTKFIEVPEVNSGGCVVPVLAEELGATAAERKYQETSGRVRQKPGHVRKDPLKPTFLVKSKVWFDGSRYHFKASVVMMDTGEELFAEEVDAPRLVGVEGWWDRVGPNVWRHRQAGTSAKPGYETKYMRGLGLDNYREDLTLMLRVDENPRWTEYKNITEKIKAIMRSRGYQVT